MMPNASCDIFLGDSLGELGLFYRLAPIAFIGGSLVPHGGHNPLEAARLDCALLLGPHTENFEAMTASLNHQGAVRQVPDGDALTAALRHLFNDDEELAGMIRKARLASEREIAVLQRLVAALLPMLHRQRSKGQPQSTASPLEAANAGP